MANFICCLDATNCFKRDFDLELTTKLLRSRYTHKLLLCSAGCQLASLPENLGRYLNLTTLLLEILARVTGIRVPQLKHQPDG